MENRESFRLFVNIDEDKDVLLEFRRWNLDKYSMQFFLILSHVREN